MKRFLSAVVTALCLAPALGQAQAPAPTWSADSAAVMAVVVKVFDGMRTRDSSLLRTVFLPNAQLIGVSRRNGAPAPRLDVADTFIRAVGAPSEATWNESIFHPEVRIDGDIATVWTQYDFHLGDTFSHCGIDAFLLARTADGWKIASLADTRQREGCPER